MDRRVTCRRLQRPRQSPKCPPSGTGCEYVTKKENLLTNCNVDESPVGDTCSGRDRIRETAANYHVEGNRSSEETGNSPPGSQNFIAVLDKFLIANVRCMSPII